MTMWFSRRLEGLEPDNLLAFLAVLGLLRALEAADAEKKEKDRFMARAAWDRNLPLRPLLFTVVPAELNDVAEAAARGVELLAAAHDFGGAKNLAFTQSECRAMLKDVAERSSIEARDRADLISGLMSDGVVKRDDKSRTVQPTPLCLQFGQGHQYFLERLASVPRNLNAVTRGRG